MLQQHQQSIDCLLFLDIDPLKQFIDPTESQKKQDTGSSPDFCLSSNSCIYVDISSTTGSCLNGLLCHFLNADDHHNIHIFFSRSAPCIKIKFPFIVNHFGHFHHTLLRTPFLYFGHGSTPVISVSK